MRRCAGERSAWIRAALWPTRWSTFQTLSARRLVRVKTRVERSSSSRSASRSGSFSSWPARKSRCSARSAVVPERTTSTRTGSCWKARANSPTSPPMVAENSSVWRAFGSRWRILVSWGLNPMSSIRSASSRTRISIRPSFAEPFWMWSTSRPGVAMITSWSRSCADWFPIPTPPMTTAPRMWRAFPKRSSCSAIWSASSRVGARTSARGPGGAVRAESLSMMGSRNAAVFPVPVAAAPITSLPASPGGMAWAWMGVGASNPARVRAVSVFSESFRSAKVVNVCALIACAEARHHHPDAAGGGGRPRGRARERYRTGAHRVESRVPLRGAGRSAPERRSLASDQADHGPPRRRPRQRGLGRQAARDDHVRGDARRQRRLPAQAARGPRLHGLASGGALQAEPRQGQGARALQGVPRGPVQGAQEVRRVPHALGATPPAASEVKRASFFDGIGYSSVWEDERVIEEWLRPGRGERALSITSGGCFTLQLLLHDVAEVVSVDFNPHQTELLALKVAAVRALDERELWVLLGLREGGDRVALYERVREALSPASRGYWDARPEVVARGAALAGRQDRYLHAVGRLVAVIQRRRRVGRLLDATGGDAQRRFYEEEWNGPVWRGVCGLVFSRF